MSISIMIHAGASDSDSLRASDSESVTQCDSEVPGPGPDVWRRRNSPRRKSAELTCDLDPSRQAGRRSGVTYNPGDSDGSWGPTGTRMIRRRKPP